MQVLVTDKENMKGSRRKARILAFQALYEIDAVGHEAQVAIDWLLENERMSVEHGQFVKELVTGVMANKNTIDGYIRQYAPAWPLQQLSIVDRNILRLAIFELLMAKNTPVKVVIDEAVELAKSFGSDNSSKFINGVLGSVSVLASPK